MSASQPDAARLLGSWQADPALVMALLLAALLYLLGARKAPGGWPMRRSAAFMAGLLTLALALLSGLDRYSGRLLSVHMAQHLLLTVLAPALLLSAAPIRLALATSPRRVRRMIASLLHGRFVTLLLVPAVGFALLASVTLAAHLTGIYELALRNGGVHALEHAAFFWSGMLFLAPLIAADPLPRAPEPVARFAWLMAAMVAMAIPGALLTFQATVRYPSYLAEARALHSSALADQHLAGVLMWVGGGLAMLVLAAIVVMRALIAEERRQRRRDAHADDALPGAPVAAARAPREVLPR